MRHMTDIHQSPTIAASSDGPCVSPGARMTTMDPTAARKVQPFQNGYGCASRRSSTENLRFTASGWSAIGWMSVGGEVNA